jgi:predicted TIM-barrel fold metal-dependent hydrolase
MRLGVVAGRVGRAVATTSGRAPRETTGGRLAYTGEPEAAMLVTDAQIHIWELDRPDRPWPKDARTTPHIEGGWSAEQMLAEMEAAGVDRAVIVPPSWAGESNDYAIESSERYRGRFAVMGRFDPEAPDVRERLAGWLDQPHMLGIRLTFNTPRFVQWLADGTLDWFWAECERLRIPLMCQLARQMNHAEQIAERHPGLTIIIDHMGRVSGTKGAAAFADLDDLLAVARFPNVLVKTTSVPSYSEEPYPFSDIQPYVRRIYDAFGPRRMLWGSDISRLPVPYRECLLLFQEALDFLSAEDREWVLGKSAAEALGWPEA